MTEPNFLSATQLLDAYRSKSLSPVEVTQACLDQIERIDGTLNGWCLVDAESALASARASEERYAKGAAEGLLDGVPTAVKDIFLTEGWPTLKGSKLTDPSGPWDVDAPTVSACKRNNAVLVGKTTTPELGWKGVTDSPVYGITRNPWDPTKTAGGSSGGTAIAVVCGQATVGLGTDGGGSIRIPCGFTGHPGIKPTYGVVPHWPPSPYGTMAHAGPHARSVRDVALLLTVLAEPDVRDWTALPPTAVRFHQELDGGIEGLRVAYSPTLGHVDVDPEVRELVDRAARAFDELGATVEEADPGFEDPVDMFWTLWAAGAAQATKQHSKEDRAEMDPGLAEIIAMGESYDVLEYTEANVRRAQLGVHMNRFHESYDLLLTPTLPIPAFEAGLEVPPGSEGRRWTSWTPFAYPFNLTQQPAASVPCGFTEDGLPVGLQIVGPKYADVTVLRAAHAYETAHPTDRRPPILEGDA